MSSFIPSSLTHYAIILVFTLTAYCAYRLSTSTRPHFPPGPKPAPLIGNILQVSAEHPELLFQRWASKFGSFIICVFFLSDLPGRDRRSYLPSSFGAANDRVKQPGRSPGSYGQAELDLL